MKTRLAPIGTAAPVLAGENRTAIAALESELEKKRAVDLQLRNMHGVLVVQTRERQQSRLTSERGIPPLD